MQKSVNLDERINVDNYFREYPFAESDISTEVVEVPGHKETEKCVTECERFGSKSCQLAGTPKIIQIGLARGCNDHVELKLIVLPEMVTNISV
ncbi:hypothetical protein COOONC_11003 [Cooperia oncophora]